MISIRSFVLAILCIATSTIGLSGCASKGKEQAKEEPPFEPIKKIAILPIQNPRRFTLDKSGSPLFLLGAIQHIEIAAKNDGFSNKMRENKLPIGDEMMVSLEQGLIAQNYEVIVLHDQNMGFAAPKDFDYRKVTTDADAMIHVIINEAGVASPLRSTNYIPQLNVDVYIISAKDQRNVDDWGVDYGADASKLDNGNIPADAKFAWGTYEILMKKIPDVVDGLQQGAKLLGPHIAKTMRERKL
jgi:hypothetical protein